MITLAVLRHGSTEWNEARRIQGRRDIALSERGRREVALWRIPAPWRADVRWLSSPLRRASETATIVAGSAPELIPALIEMDWGEYEGFRLDELRERHGAAFAANEARGLDFHPPQGESPRMVLERVTAWLREFAAEADDAIAVTHKGVIRSLLVAATGWDMLGRPPVRLQPGCLHEFAVGADGRIALARPNVTLGCHARS